MPESEAFWEPLGFVTAEEAAEPYPHLTLTSDHLDLAFHAPEVCARPMLVFRAADMGARLERLRTLGFAPGPALPPVRAAAGSALLEAPGATPLLLLEAGD